MRTARIRVNSEAMSAKDSLSDDKDSSLINRRVALTGLALAPMAAAAAATSVSASEIPSLHEGTKRVHALAAELSRALAKLDHPLPWQAVVKPAWHEYGVFEIQELGLSADVILARSLRVAAEALRKITPGNWQTEQRKNFVILFNASAEEEA